MMRYFITLEAKILQIERAIWPINKSGYLEGCKIFVKILPNLIRGLQVIGFLNPMQEKEEGEPEAHFIMINMLNGIILGITENFFTDFGMPSRFTYGFATTSN